VDFLVDEREKELAKKRIKEEEESKSAEAESLTNNEEEVNE